MKLFNKDMDGPLLTQIWNSTTQRAGIIAELRRNSQPFRTTVHVTGIRTEGSIMRSMTGNFRCHCSTANIEWPNYFAQFFLADPGNFYLSNCIFTICPSADIKNVWPYKILSKKILYLLPDNFDIYYSISIWKCQIECFKIC